MSPDAAPDRWLDHCLALPGAWRDEPWEGDVVAKVGPPDKGKVFAFLGSPEGRLVIGLKCGDREQADLWLERYPGAASKMRYWGQHGWNTFAVDGTVPDDDLRELIEGSYALVVAKLPRAQRPG